MPHFIDLVKMYIYIGKTLINKPLNLNSKAEL